MSWILWLGGEAPAPVPSSHEALFFTQSDPPAAVEGKGRAGELLPGDNETKYWLGRP